MRLPTETRVAVGALLALQLLTAFGAIGLLSRMSPAVERILQENVYSTWAVEEMLVVLAKGAPEDQHASFLRAFDRAKDNITEPEEDDILKVISQASPGALAGPGADRVRVAEQLVALGEVNRLSMERADRYARTLGFAGAWAVVLLGLVTFVISVLVFRRLDVRLVAPMVEVDEVLAEIRRGDPHRRCLRLEGPTEVLRIRDNLNWILDARERGALKANVSEDEPTLDRPLLITLLDAIEGPAVAGGPTGRVLAMNASALEGLPGGMKPRELGSKIAEGEVPEGWAVSEGAEGVWVARRA